MGERNGLSAGFQIRIFFEFNVKGLIINSRKFSLNTYILSTL